MRLFQLVPVLGYGDAIGNDVLAIRDVTKEARERAYCP